MQTNLHTPGATNEIPAHPRTRKHQESIFNEGEEVMPEWDWILDVGASDAFQALGVIVFGVAVFVVMGWAMEKWG